MRAILLSNIVLHWLTLPQSYLAVKTWVRRFPVKLHIRKFCLGNIDASTY